MKVTSNRGAYKYTVDSKEIRNKEKWMGTRSLSREAFRTALRHYVDNPLAVTFVYSRHSGATCLFPWKFSVRDGYLRIGCRTFSKKDTNALIKWALKGE